MPLTQAFASTKVSLDRSMSQIEGILEKEGIRESRYTHRKPVDPAATEGEDAAGSLTLEFIRSSADKLRRGIRITVAYQPTVVKIDARTYTRRKVKGTTADMAARALFWYLETKFKSIQYGLEEFDTAFMPHLVTQIGMTMAEQPQLVERVLDQPENIGRFLLPASDGSA